MFDRDDPNSPKNQGSAAAYALCCKMDEWMHSLNQETHHVTSPTGHLIKTLHFTNCNALLVECESNASAAQLKEYCRDTNGR